MAKKDPGRCFKDFRATTGFTDTLSVFSELCSSLNLDPLQYDTVYERVKKGVTLQEVQALFKCLDKRASHKEYFGDQGQRACQGNKVLIVGAGPCGLRMAIECALLGAKVVVIEMRSYISRNNVLHLWPFVIQDIKLLGGKVFHPRFCVGAIDHVSIKRLQVMLLKICLCLGVEVHTPVKFEKVLEPNQQLGHGWRVKLDQDNHPASRFDYDFIVGANGKNNSLPDFSRKTMRAKLAIAITANFINRQSTADAKVQEVGGLSFIFDQEFFNGLKESTGADLENFVYYKDDTHYFVMTPKKYCLLKKGVIKQDYTDPKRLLSPENIDRSKLQSFTQEVALKATAGQLPSTQFEVNHHDKEDLAIFDFTSMSMANHACFAREQGGHVLMQCIVGDNLLEPFWPQGTGCARGFLGVFDAAWLMRNWSLKEMAPLHLIAERESIFRILSQTKPEANMSVIKKYTINPSVRYGTKIKTKTLMRPSQVKNLYVRSSPADVDMPARITSNKGRVSPKSNGGSTVSPDKSNVQKDNLKDSDTEEEEASALEMRSQKSRKRSRGGTLDTKELLEWFGTQLDQYRDLITLTDLHQSWKNGLAFCALVQIYRPQLLDVRQMDPGDKANNLQIAFVLIEQEFGVCPLLSVEDLMQSDSVNGLAMLSYLTQLRDALESERPPKMPKIHVSAASIVLETPQVEEYDPFLEEVVESPLEDIEEEAAVAAGSPLSPHGMLLKVAHSTALQGLKKSVENAKAWMKDKATDKKSQEEHRQAVLLSKRTVSFKSPKMRPTGSKLSRKKVMFKVPPPAVVKYRKSQVDIMSGESNVEDYMKQRGLLMSGSYDNAPNAVDYEATEEGLPSILPQLSSLPSEQGNVLSRVAIFEEKFKEPQPFSRKKPGESASKATPLRGRPSLAHCRGVARGRILQYHKHQEDTPNSTPGRPKSPVINSKQVKPGHSVAGERRKDQCIDAVDSPPEPDRSQRRPLAKLPDYMLQSVARMACMNQAQNKIHLFERNQPQSNTGKGKQPESEGVQKPEIQMSSGEVCCICEKTLYVVERHSAHGQFFHKNCYRCKTCNTMLRLGNSLLRKRPDQPVEFYCYSHAYTSGALDVNWDGQSENKTVESATDGPSSSQQESILCYDLNLSEDFENVMGTETEDDSSSDESGAEDSPTELSSKHFANKIYTHTLRSQRSLRLLVADDIKQGLDEVDDEEEKLEEQGHSVEERIRTGNRDDMNEEVMDQWLDIIRKKKELVEKESKLMLKKKLVELQDRHNQLQMLITSKGLDESSEETLNTAVAKLESDTEDLEDEMGCLVLQMNSLTTYLDTETVV